MEEGLWQLLESNGITKMPFINHQHQKQVLISLNRDIKSKPGLRNMSSHSGLNIEEAQVFLDMPRAWLEHRPWTLTDACNINMLWEYVDAHGMGGILGNLVISKLVDRDNLFDVARRQYFSNSLHYEHSRRACKHIAQVAATLKMPLLLLKGPALVNQAYADSGVRAYRDLDLFVRSHDDAECLVDGLSARNEAVGDYPQFIKRIKNPGEIRTVFGGWTLEISYPVAPNIDPMQDYLATHKERVFNAPPDPESILNPDPNIHFVYMLMHMTLNHFCSRLIWFLDLVTFAQHRRNDLDWEQIVYDLGNMELLNIASHISGFCRRHIDPAFPAFESKRMGWNDSFQKSMLEPELLLRSNLGVYHQGWGARFHSNCLYTSIFYLLGDPSAKRFCPSLTATRRSAARFLYGIGLKHRFLLRFAEVISALIIFPFAYLVSWSILIKLSHSGKQDDE
jgi:hypothetical protein